MSRQKRKTCKNCGTQLTNSNKQSNGYTPKGTKKYKPTCSSCTSLMQFKLFQEKLQEAYGKLIACMDCGYNEYLVGIDWHHLNPSEKDKNIAEMKTYSVERLQQELQKCIPLCAICHRVRHLHEGKALG